MNTAVLEVTVRTQHLTDAEKTIRAQAYAQEYIDSNKSNLLPDVLLIQNWAPHEVVLVTTGTRCVHLYKDMSLLEATRLLNAKNLESIQTL